MPTLTIIDYGIGNITSLSALLNNLKINFKISRNKKIIKNSDIVLLPGVGNFEYAVQNLKKNKIFFFLKNLIKSGKPTIGICLGMQLLFEESEESKVKGLGIFKKKIRLIKKNIGWYKIKFSNKEYKNYFKDNFFYFNHSYALLQQVGSLGKISGSKNQIAIFKKKKIVAMQFHPEKSQDSGYRLFSKVLKDLLLEKSK
jgi:glutamine amidotransferase